MHVWSRNIHLFFFITCRFVCKLLVLTINIKIERTVNVRHTFVMRASTTSDACQSPITIYKNINLLLNTKTSKYKTFFFDKKVENKKKNSRILKVFVSTVIFVCKQIIFSILKMLIIIFYDLLTFFHNDIKISKPFIKIWFKKRMQCK